MTYNTVIATSLIPVLLLFAMPIEVRAESAAPARSASTTVQIASRHKKAPSSRRRGCDTSTTPQYRRMRQNWQSPPKIPAPQWRYGYRDLTLYAVNTGVRVRVFPFLEDGTLDPEIFPAIEEIMADKYTGGTHPVHPRLIMLLYQLSDHFDARQIIIISGYREFESARSTESHHATGSAVDFVISGVPIARVAQRARRLGHVGVGFYPNAGFVHLDVRTRSSYFWADPSGPGKRSCHRPIMKEHIATFDRRWKPEHDEPVPRQSATGELRHTIRDRADQADQSVPQKKGGVQ